MFFILMTVPGRRLGRYPTPDRGLVSSSLHIALSVLEQFDPSGEVMIVFFSYIVLQRFPKVPSFTHNSQIWCEEPNSQFQPSRFDRGQALPY
jgi:hypothetical protein